MSRRDRRRRGDDRGPPPHPQGDLLGAPDADDLDDATDESGASPEGLDLEPIWPREPVLFEMIHDPPARRASDREGGAAGADEQDRSESGRGTREPGDTPDPGAPRASDAALAPADAESGVEGAVPVRSIFDETNPDAAYEQLLAVRAANPDDVPTLVSLGWSLGAMRRYEEAERELRRAQKLAPEDVAVRAGLGVLFFRRGLYQQADAELRWVCEQDPEHGPAHFYRGEALNRLGRVDQALDALERAVVLQPDNHRAFYTLGILYDRKNLREQAAAMFRKARELQRR